MSLPAAKAASASAAVAQSAIASAPASWIAATSVSDARAVGPRSRGRIEGDDLDAAGRNVARGLDASA